MDHSLSCLTVTDPIQRGIQQSQDARSHALSLPELISQIFEFLPDTVLCSGWVVRSRFTPYALVCRAWLIHAIRKIWRRSSPSAVIILIPSWQELIYETELPTTEHQKHTPEEIEDIVSSEWRWNPGRYHWSIWAKSLLPKDYNRFMFYQQYIITLENLDSSVPQMIMDAFINAPSSPFRPGISQPFQNLSKLEWDVSLKGYPQEQSSLSMLLLVSVRPQQIRSLTLDDISNDIPLPDFRSPLFLSQLVCLEDINLPLSPSPLLTVCFEALSRIKHLTRIVAIPPGPFIAVKETTFNPVFYKGSFPALRMLHIRWSLEDIISFFQLDNAPSGLQTLIMDHGPTLSSPQVMKDAFREIAKRCDNIKHFHFRSPAGDLQVGNNFEPDMITFQMLEPLISLHRMEEFELTTPFNIGLTDTEVISRWRGLRLFKLVGTLGRDRVEPKPALNVLKLLAQCCPNLRKLGLSISLTDIPRQEPEDDIPLFPVLETLEVYPGISHCKPRRTSWGSPSPVHYGDVHYLVSACPLTCDIDCCLPVWVENHDADDDDARRASLWRDKARFEIIRKQRECFIKKTRILEDTIRRLDSSLKH